MRPHLTQPVRILTLILGWLVLISCSSQDQEPIELEGIAPQPLETNLALPDNRFSDTYRIVLFGNSHVSGLDRLLTTILEQGEPVATVYVENAGGGFLDDQGSRQRRTSLLQDDNWTHVILQGQKYSQSGITTYPITSAQRWIELAKSLNTTPIMFPEHPQRGNTKEGFRVHQIHTGIAELQTACVAPIGLTWDKALETKPELSLHHSDGNHAILAGKFLTAMVFYEVITGNSAELLPYIATIDVDQETQSLLRQMATQTLKEYPACQFPGA